MDVQEGDDQESSQSLIEAELSIDEYRKQIEQEQRREEILFQKQLKEYGLSFKELLEQSPKHTDARQNAIKVAYTLVENEELASILHQKNSFLSNSWSSSCRSAEKRSNGTENISSP